MSDNSKSLKIVNTPVDNRGAQPNGLAGKSELEKITRDLHVPDHYTKASVVRFAYFLLLCDTNVFFLGYVFSDIIKCSSLRNNV